MRELAEEERQGTWWIWDLLGSADLPSAGRATGDVMSSKIQDQIQQKNVPGDIK
jgi:hypothetical protein